MYVWTSTDSFDRRTVAKISLSSSGQILDTLQKDIPLESIPKALGGTFEEFNEPFVFDTSETGPFYLSGDPIPNLISPTTVLRSADPSSESSFPESDGDLLTAAKISSQSLTSSLFAATSDSTSKEDGYREKGRVDGENSCAQDACVAAVDDVDDDDVDNDDDKLPRRV